MKGLIDSTLREGSQMVGATFTLEEKKRILSFLIALGVEEIEIGVATAYDRDLPDLMRYIRRKGGRTRIGLWCPCRTENIVLALSLAPDVLALSIPASELLIRKRLQLDPARVLAIVKQSVLRAKEGCSSYVSLGLEDATRADEGFLRQLILTAAAAGADRVRLADTVGIATPGTIASLVRTVRACYQGDIGVHMHNDFGQAGANSISALEAGADYADVTVLGTGERAGNAKLEEVAGFLALRGEQSYDCTLFRPLARLVAACTGRSIDPFQPLIGERIFHCETGLHLQGLKTDTATYEPYSPEKVGVERQWFYGAKIGKREIQECLAGSDISLQFKQLEKLVRQSRRMTQAMKHPLPQHEFTALLAALQRQL